MNKELTSEERYYISTTLKNGSSISQIAIDINRHKSTVSREIKRNSGRRGYRYKQAQAKALASRMSAKKYKKIDAKLLDRIIRYLKFGLSPEQIVGRLKLKLKRSMSIEWIYQFIWQDKKNGGNLYGLLRRKGKRYRHRGNAKDSRGIITNRVNISKRPEIVQKRERIGDWEIDLVCGKARSGYLVTATERSLNLNRIGVSMTKECKEIEDVVVSLLSDIKDHVFTITSDNGKEFANHEQIAKRLEADYYFANPYSSWERGTNENANGLIRQYFPKKEHFIINEAFRLRVKIAERRLNNRPRKKLKYNTPNEIYLKECVAIIT